MTTIYVVAPEGRMIFGFGSREYGESWELPDEIVLDLLGDPAFSLTPPQVEEVLDDDSE